ncbi:MAG: PEP-CTERM sorting domain-containing protein [Deltaproteobacteria bacterium]|nr:PEP-CTERM sorting domain-containing protein [Deltaproteobacteria bacterium]
MKRNLKILMFLLLVVFLSSGNVSAEIIDDNYIGSDDNGYGDVIQSSNTNVFQIDNMDVTFSGGFMNVKINTNFKESTSDTRDFPTYGSKYGDLFISTDGWSPSGSSSDGYKIDNYTNGEDWEFVFDTSDGILYQLPAYTDSNISNYILFPENIWPTNFIYRNGQEVLYKANGNSIADDSTVDLSNAGDGGYLLYKIELASLGEYGDIIGLKWSQDCGNDSIEGGASVPEPTPMLLLGAALVGLAGIGRRKFFKN